MEAVTLPLFSKSNWLTDQSGAPLEPPEGESQVSEITLSPPVATKF